MYNHNTEKLVSQACNYFGTPFDDRLNSYEMFSSPHGAEPAHATLHMVAQKMGISVVKARKLLITGSFYSTKRSRSIQSLYDKALDEFHHKGFEGSRALKMAIESVSSQIGLGKASVYSYIPYRVTAYNLEDRSPSAIRQERYRHNRTSRPSEESHPS